MKKFYDIYTKEEISNAMNNKYLLSFKYKLDGKMYISEKYGIVIRNVNKIEKDILSQSLIFKIHRIISLFEKPEDIFDDETVKIRKIGYLKQFSDFDDKTIIRFDLDGYEQYNIFDKIIKITKDNYHICNSKNKATIAKKIANKYLEKCVVLYSENKKMICDLIKENTDYDDEDIDTFEAYDDFINKYMELWKSINYCQHWYIGFNVQRINTHLKSIIDISNLEEDTNFEEYLKIFKSPISVDLSDGKLFYFLINKFYSCYYYIDNDNKILLYFSLLELLLTHKPSDSNDISIVNQLCNNIKECIEKYGELSINEKEIKELYDYRSLLVHGNIEKKHKFLRKIKKNDYFVKMIKKLDFENFDEYDSIVIDIVRIRVLEIFRYIYKTYCKDYEFIKLLKNR